MLGNLIKEERIRLNLSQRELAKQTNVNNALISRIEAGKIVQPSFSVLKKLSDVLNIDIVKLLLEAHYTNKEIYDLGIISDYESKGVCGSDKMYLFNTNNYIDIVKILNYYHNDKLTLNETLGLLSIATQQDITKYIPPVLREKYNIDIIKYEKK